MQKHAYFLKIFAHVWAQNCTQTVPNVWSNRQIRPDRARRNAHFRERFSKTHEARREKTKTTMPRNFIGLRGPRRRFPKTWFDVVSNTPCERSERQVPCSTG